MSEVKVVEMFSTGERKKNISSGEDAFWDEVFQQEQQEQEKQVEEKDVV